MLEQLEAAAKPCRNRKRTQRLGANQAPWVWPAPPSPAGRVVPTLSKLQRISSKPTLRRPLARWQRPAVSHRRAQRLQLQARIFAPQRFARASPPTWPSTVPPTPDERINHQCLATKHHRQQRWFFRKGQEWTPYSAGPNHGNHADTPPTRRTGLGLVVFPSWWIGEACRPALAAVRRSTKWQQPGAAADCRLVAGQPAVVDEGAHGDDYLWRFWGGRIGSVSEQPLQTSL